MFNLLYYIQFLLLINFIFLNIYFSFNFFYQIKYIINNNLLKLKKKIIFEKKT